MLLKSPRSQWVNVDFPPFIPQVIMTIEKDRSHSPVHLHVDDATPVHVHVKKPKKAGGHGEVSSSTFIFLISTIICLPITVSVISVIDNTVPQFTVSYVVCWGYKW